MWMPARRQNVPTHRNQVSHYAEHCVLRSNTKCACERDGKKTGEGEAGKCAKHEMYVMCTQNGRHIRHRTCRDHTTLMRLLRQHLSCVGYNSIHLVVSQ